jgi:hypothetical protein
MIRGTNSASTTARAISASKAPMAVAVSISPRNSALSQPARFWIMRAKPIFMYGSSRASDPPIRWISLVAVASATSSTSSMVTMPISTPAESVTGRAVRSKRRKAATAVCWSSVALSATTRRSINALTGVSRDVSRNSRARTSSISMPCWSIT